MKNLFLFSILTVTLLLTSCSKETTLFSELETISLRETQKDIVKSSTSFKVSDDEQFQSSAKGDKTIQLQVISVIYSFSSNDFTVTFSGNHDFSNSEVKINQTLDFHNATSNTSTLSFQSSHPVGSTNLLQLTFDMGSHNLNGLNLGNLQEIIIEEDIVD